MFVPTLLIRERFSGAVLAIPIGVIIGTFFLYVFANANNKFPEKGITEILEVTPRWFQIGFLAFLAIMWFCAGCVSLIAFNNVTIRFLNPDFAGVHMILAFTVTIFLILIRLKTIQILYALEIILVINIPLIALILIQAYTNDYMSWPAIMEIGTYYKEIPSFGVVSAATFVFSGYTNMVIFNQVFKERIKIKRLWFIPILGFITLFTTLFVPIGLWGADGVGDLSFPWVTTADTLRIEFGPVERLITIFLLLYISISLMSVVVHWHVAFEVTKSILPIKKLKASKQNIVNLGILISFIVAVIFLEGNLREEGLMKLGELWLKLRFPSEAAVVGIMFLLARRKKHEKEY